MDDFEDLVWREQGVRLRAVKVAAAASFWRNGQLLT